MAKVKQGNVKQARASAKYVRMSPSKVRYVLDLVRGKPAVVAQQTLQFTPRAAAREVAKVLDAAIANAGFTLRAEADELVLAECWADEGPTLKRWMPRAQGRATRIRKRTCHITVVVQPREV